MADILRVREALLSGSRFVLTTRTLHGKSVPLRSRVGNDLSRFFFSLAAGCFLEDNQSGLRGFSTDCLPWLTEIGGEKYDYEMNVLLYAAPAGAVHHAAAHRDGLSRRQPELAL